MTTKTSPSFIFPLSNFLTRRDSEGLGGLLSRTVTMAAIADFLFKGENVVVVGNELRELIGDELAKSIAEVPKLDDSVLKAFVQFSRDKSQDLKWSDIIQNYKWVSNSLVESFRVISACDTQKEGWTQIMLNYQSLVLQNSTALLEFEMMSVEQHGDLPPLTTLLNIVLEAKELYDSRFSLLETTNPFNESVFIRDEKDLGLSVLLKYLSNYILKGELLAQRFVEFFSKVRLRMGLERVQLIDNTLRQLYNVRDSSDIADEKLRIFQQLVESIHARRIDLGFSIKGSNDLNTSDFHILLLQYINILEKYSKSPVANSAEYLKSINVSNYDDKELVKIEEDLAEWVKSVEDSQLFVKTIENNASSSLKKYQGLLDIIIFLKIAQKRAEEMDNFYTWKTFTSKLTKYQQKLISALQPGASENWVELTKTWYFKECLRRVTRFSTQNPGSDFVTYVELSQLIASNYPGIIASILRDRKLNKASKKSLKLDQRNLHVSQEGNRTNFEGKEYNTALSFNINLPEELSDKTVYIASSKQAVNDSLESVYYINIASEQNMRELIHASQVKNEISQEGIDQKLSLARMLAKSLLESSVQLKCYITQSSNIILDCHSEIQSMIKDQWQDERLKSIRLGTDQNNALIEFLLNDSSKGFYIYDYISANNQLSLYQQAQKVKAMENAGYRTIYFDPILMANDQDYFIQFHKLLNDAN